MAERVVVLQHFELDVVPLPPSFTPDSSIRAVIPMFNKVEDYIDLDALPAYFKRTEWGSRGTGLQSVVNDSFLDLTDIQKTGVVSVLSREEENAICDCELTIRGSSGKRSKEIRKFFV